MKMNVAIPAALAFALLSSNAFAAGDTPDALGRSVQAPAKPKACPANQVADCGALRVSFTCDGGYQTTEKPNLGKACMPVSGGMMGKCGSQIDLPASMISNARTVSKWCAY